MGTQAELLANVGFHLRVDFGKGPNRPGDLTGFDTLSGVLEAFLVPFHFRVPAGQLQTKGGWFGVDPVGAAHTDGVLKFAGPVGQDVHEVLDVLAQDVVNLL